MILQKSAKRLISPRIGFHYFQDTNHYTNRDLSTCLTQMNLVSAKWLLLRSDPTRAIPETFLSGLISAGITPVIHMHLSLPNTPGAGDLKSILEAYARWGIKYIILFDEPNSMDSWTASGWSQQSLVERFIDRFLPLALVVAQLGMTPIFPPLQPGGNYWDLTFFKQSLQSLQRRGYSSLIHQLALSAYTYTFNHELDWGHGGPDKWTRAKPYKLAQNEQDQRGFYHFEWIQSITKKITGLELPLFLLGAGNKSKTEGFSPEIHAEISQNILERLNGIPEKKQIPDYVKSCCFYLLSAEPDTENVSQAWFKGNEEVLPIVRMIAPETTDHSAPSILKEASSQTKVPPSDSHPINHYLLLPVYEWGVADFHLEATKEYIRKFKPTVGFSIEEAFLAKKVTAFGGEQTFPEETLARLIENGCEVERISGDGTSIATLQVER